MFEIIVEKEGLEFLCWRKVPTNPGILGHKAVAVMPYIMQAFVKRPKNVERGLDFDRKLFVVRRVFEQSNEDTYVPSLSSRTIVYKGMFLVGELRCRMRIMSQPLVWYIPDSQRTQHRAGCVRIHIVSLFTMVRSIQSVVTKTV